MTVSITAQYRQSLDAPEEFWGAAAAEIDWIRPWDRVLGGGTAPHERRWFEGALCNTCYNAVDRHVRDGRGNQPALFYDSPVTGSSRRLTYAELLDQISRCAGLLRALGVGKGDRVVIYMPMIPEALIGMLAAARIGAVHSVVFGGFAAPELAVRIADATPKVILTASCGIEPARTVPYQPMVEEALRLAPGAVQRVVVVQRPQQAWKMDPARDLDWTTALDSAEPADCVPVAATDPLYILYTSGTTGKPKGVVRDTGGHMVALKWSMTHIYGVKPGEVFWAGSDVGWVVGHSYIVYAPLLHGCTTVMFEGKPGGTPDAGAFWRVIADYGVSVLFTAPTAFRAIRRADPEGKLMGGYDLSRFRTLFLAGERSDPETLKWAEEKLKVPAIDHWWQTETGWSIAAGRIGPDAPPLRHGSVGRPAPGYALEVLDPQAKPLPAGEMGALCVRLPLPPGCFPTLWQAPRRFFDSYMTAYPGYYETGDAGWMDAEGRVFVMSRTDDIINVAGHRLSTGAMEEVLAAHPDVAEAAVVGIADTLKGQLPLGLVVLKAGVDRDQAVIAAETVAMVRERIGPVAALKTVLVTGRLPKTRSGKILRRTLREIADGADWKTPPTIEDPGALEEIAALLQNAGYGKKA